MYDAKKIIIGIIIFFCLLSFPIWVSAASGEITYTPTLTLPTNATECIESTDYMSANHFNMLLTWREEVVRDNLRVYTNSEGKEYVKSLTGTCLDCHIKTEFCDVCHPYNGVQPNCWNCHVDPEGSE